MCKSIFKGMIFVTGLLVAQNALAAGAANQDYLDFSLAGPSFDEVVKWPAYTHHPECFPNDRINAACFDNKVVNLPQVIEQVHQYCHKYFKNVWPVDWPTACSKYAPSMLKTWPHFLSHRDDYISEYYARELQKYKNTIKNQLSTMANCAYEEGTVDVEDVKPLITILDNCLRAAKKKSDVGVCSNAFQDAFYSL